MKGRVHLIGEMIANGGIGLQGDIITVSALGGMPLTTITQVATVRSVGKMLRQPLGAQSVQHQLSACYETQNIDCVKLGALGSAEIVTVVADFFQDKDIQIVLNPILMTDFGEILLDSKGVDAMKAVLLPQTSILVLSVREAEILTGEDITDVDSMCAVASSLCKYGCETVLITGGILQGELLYEVWASDEGETVLSSPKGEHHLQQTYTYSGGWVLATAIATSLAQDLAFPESINRGRQFVDQAIASAFKADGGYQNMNLLHTIKPFHHDQSFQPFSVIHGGRS